VKRADRLTIIIRSYDVWRPPNDTRYARAPSCVRYRLEDTLITERGGEGEGRTNRMWNSECDEKGKCIFNVLHGFEVRDRRLSAHLSRYNGTWTVYTRIIKVVRFILKLLRYDGTPHTCIRTVMHLRNVFHNVRFSRLKTNFETFSISQRFSFVVCYTWSWENTPGTEYVIIIIIIIFF